jgi:predicted dehydrogenase
MSFKNHKQDISRRKFIANSTIAMAGISGAAAGLPSSLFASNSLWRSDNLRLGIIGMGSRGGGIANTVKNLPGITITACCDSLPEHLSKGLSVLDKGIKGYADYRQLLNDPRVDAVVITLPQHLHYKVAVDALDANKHVYLEKTMTHTIDEAISLASIVAKKSRLVFQVGHQYRYFQMYHRIAEMMKKGWLGDVLQFECQYHRNANWRKPVTDPKLERHINWRMYREYSGGLMTELCSHQLDLVNWLTNSHPIRISAMGGIDYWKDGRETYDNIRGLFEYPGGIKVNASSILSNAYKGFSIRILGTKGTIEVQQNKAHFYAEAVKKELTTVDGVTGATANSWGQGKPVLVEYKNQDEFNRNPTAYAFLDFANCIKTGRKPLADVEAGKTNAIAVHLANQSADTGKFVNWI